MADKKEIADLLHSLGETSNEVKSYLETIGLKSVVGYLSAGGKIGKSIGIRTEFVLGAPVLRVRVDGELHTFSMLSYPHLKGVRDFVLECEG